MASSWNWMTSVYTSLLLWRNIMVCILFTHHDNLRVLLVDSALKYIAVFQLSLPIKKLAGGYFANVSCHDFFPLTTLGSIAFVCLPTHHSSFSVFYSLCCFFSSFFFFFTYCRSVFVSLLKFLLI